MAQALRVKGNLFMLVLDNPLRPTDDNVMEIYSADVKGVVVNVEQTHWVAFRLMDNGIWLLDSQLSPKWTTFEGMLTYISTYHNAFVVRVLNQ